MVGKVLSINSSENRGTNKYPIPKGNFKTKIGLVGDGHSGDWHRQVSIFCIDSLMHLSNEERIICEETYSENITIEGIKIHVLPIGTMLKIGEVVFKITQIGKPFEKDPSMHTAREIIMHKEGVFVVVEKGGEINVGEIVTCIEGSN